MTGPFEGRTLLHCVIAIGAALLSLEALAEQPAISAPGLGATEATLDFCARIDPKSAQQYWEQAKSLLQGLDAKTAGEIRNTDEYRQAYDTTAEMIAKAPHDDAMRACNETVAANR